ncbi:hypothetical protein FS749_010269 [Ceratobasidium sp. UAMH 11750]|nr:hypothetical protein FS749_010269 [Ceratobasidium sp. UAMH 11750]
MAAVATHEIPDTSKRANEVEKLFCIIGSHFNRWEKDPSILPDIPYFDRTILHNRNRFVRMINRIDALLDTLRVQRRAPCLKSCPASGLASGLFQMHRSTPLTSLHPAPPLNTNPLRPNPLLNLRPSTLALRLVVMPAWQ